MFSIINVAQLALTVKAHLCTPPPFPPTLSIHAPSVYVHESHTSARQLFAIPHPRPQTWGEGKSQVSLGLRMSEVPVMWKENVVSWQRSCSIFIVPLNKHMGLDELVSIQHGAQWESVAGGPLAMQPITRLSVHTSGYPSSGTDDTHTYVTCSASSKTPSHKYTLHGRHSGSSNQSPRTHAWRT